jgi:dUTP pyrophosphatase
MSRCEVRFKRVGEVAVPLPEYQTPDSAGMDLRAALREPVRIAPGQRTLIPTGLALAIPRGFEGQVRPRSGLALKHGISIVNTPGTIDADYRGEVSIVLINLGQEPFVVEPLSRIAQLVIAPVIRVATALVDTLDDTARGSGGYGSTGR